MKKGLVCLIALLCIFMFAAVGCSPDETPQNTQDTQNTENTQDTYYTVTFDSRGGSAVESQRVHAGNPVRRPEAPDYGGYDFVGWFTDENAEVTLWDFDTDRVNSDMTLYAGWQEQSQEPTASLVYELEGDSYIVTPRFCGKRYCIGRYSGFHNGNRSEHIQQLRQFADGKYLFGEQSEDDRQQRIFGLFVSHLDLYSRWSGGAGR